MADDSQVNYGRSSSADQDKDKDKDSSDKEGGGSSSRGHRKHISANFLLSLPSTSSAMSFVSRPRSKSSLSKFFSDQIAPRLSREEKDLSTNPSLPQNSYGSKPRKFFGMPLPLDESLLIDGVPRIVYRCVQNLRDRGLTSEGLFRVPGSAGDMKLLREAYENDEDPDLSLIRANTIASLLKTYLRELPDPVISFEHYDLFISVAGIPIEDERIQKTKKAVTLLPEANRTILVFLVPFLGEVAQQSDLNKMNVDNLAKVFAPTLLRSNGSAIEEAKDTPFTCQIITDFVNHANIIFGDFQLPVTTTKFKKSTTNGSGSQISRRASTLEVSRKAASFLSDVRHQRIDLVRNAIESKEVDVNVTDSKGWTALMYAANADYKEMVEYLIQAGADVNQQNNRKETALYRAANKNASGAAKALLHGGADYAICDNNGRTPFLIAAFSGSRKICQYILKKGYDVNAIDESKKTALSLAAYNGHKDLCAFLLENNADVNLTDSFGWSPLMMAAFTGSIQVIPLLLENNADVNHKTRNGKTAAKIAREQQHYDIAQLIEEYVPGKPLNVPSPLWPSGLARSKSTSGKIRSADSTPVDPTPIVKPSKAEKSGSAEKPEKERKERDRDRGDREKDKEERKERGEKEREDKKDKDKEKDKEEKKDKEREKTRSPEKEKSQTDASATNGTGNAPMTAREIKKKNRKSAVVMSTNTNLNIDSADDSAASNSDSPRRTSRRKTLEATTPTNDTSSGVESSGVDSPSSANATPKSRHIKQSSYEV